MRGIKTGVKYDGQKPRWDLLPLKVVEEVVKVLTFGSKKYADDNWQIVPGGRKRYFAACMRHLAAWQGGEAVDSETGVSHLAHAVCCLIFVLWFDMNHKGEK